ncbi:MAG: nitronate monooxygenase [Flavobacteriaceae bacterium]|nr:nitronate monooxygenase [Flavobacteriaceae bacterium]MCY4267864.1 nitronate monooxygenase [Flavobacteriaceae bacterium]
MYNRLTNLLGIRYPIIQAGMVWNSGWKLASSVSNSGGLGLIGAGSMTPEILNEHITKCQKATKLPFGVNLPLLYKQIEQHIEIILRHQVPVVFTSAGNPKIWTKTLQKEGVAVAHVVSSLKFALKAQESGVDIIVAEGFEAGGHNGREETTTMVLVPIIRKAMNLPLIAAGGIGSGRAMLAAMALGAEGVQIGSRFAITHESSSHSHFKQRVLDSMDGDTILTLKELTPVRLIKNAFYQEIKAAYQRGATKDELVTILGKGRAKLGMFEGDLNQGELEIGQVSAQFDSIKSARKLIDELIMEFNETFRSLKSM